MIGAAPMICAACQHDNRDAARFCEGCGRALPAPCPRCGRETRPSARFCDGCGAPLGAPDYTPRHLADGILRSASALEGERKQVTVLFADCVGFTGLSGRLDPEELHDIMDGFFDRILAAVHGHGGTVNQFTGDGVMALFGAPVAHEDHAQRAVDAGLAVRRAVGDYAAGLRAERGLGLAVRIGLNTGPVVVGKIGDDLRMDYTAQGETVNLAARLQAAAPAGGVLVSEATHRLVEGYYATERLGELTLKGIERPVAAHLVVQPLAGRTRFDRALERGLTPLVGREGELRFLRDCFERARQGRGHVVSLVGDGGIGKSRLVWELRKALEKEPISSFEAHTLPHAALLPFRLVVQLLERLLGLGSGEDEASAAQKLDRALTGLGDGLEWTRPHLKQLLSLPTGTHAGDGLDQAQRKRRLLEAARAVVLAASRRRPLLVVVEDLQWADPSSEEFLDFLVEALPGCPALLLCTYRPGYKPRWAERSTHQRLTLAPLSAAEAGDMLGRLLGTAELPPVERLVAARAEGNPFFIEELTSYLKGREAGLPEEGLPETIHDLLTARIDALPEPLKRTLQVASVIGREFRLRLLEAAAPAPGDVQADLAELLRLELVQQREIFPAPVYAFSHILIQQSAYQGLLLKTRAELHRRVGEALEALAGERADELLEELAEHFARSNDRGRALVYLVRAGDRAAGLFAHDEAQAHYRRALELAPHAQDRGIDRSVVLEKLADVLYARGDLAGALAAWQEVARLVPAGGERLRTAGVHRKIGAGLFAAGEPKRALESLERGLAALGGELQNVEAARLYQELGRVSFRLGDHERAMDWAARALALGAQAGAADVVSHAHNTIGVALARAGDFAKGAQSVRRSLDTALAAGLGSVACRAYTNLAVMLAVSDTARSAEYCRAGVKLAERIGDRLQQSWLYCALAGGHCTVSGDYDEGVKAAQAAIALDEELGQRSHLPIPLILLAQIYGCRGELRESERRYREALAVADEVREPQLLVPCYDGLATLAIEGGREDEAQDWIAKSRALQEATRWTSDTFLLLPFLC